MYVTELWQQMSYTSCSIPRTRTETRLKLDFRAIKMIQKYLTSAISYAIISYTDMKPQNRFRVLKIETEDGMGETIRHSGHIGHILDTQTIRHIMDIHVLQP
jgi:hypothetical protein